MTSCLADLGSLCSFHPQRAPACDRLLECGTTCTLAVTQGDQVLIANVGDTAAALVR